MKKRTKLPRRKPYTYRGKSFHCPSVKWANKSEFWNITLDDVNERRKIWRAKDRRKQAGKLINVERNKRGTIIGVEYINHCGQFAAAPLCEIIIHPSEVKHIRQR